MKTLTKEERAAMRDLKKTVREFMRDASKLAMTSIDKLQASGADIVGDHITITKEKGPILVPRDFMAAFATEMRHQYGWVTHDPHDRERNKRIKNYERMM